MGNAAIIEVAIGLIFVYSLLSILVTQINSVIINFLNLKAKRLKEQLDKLLTDPVVRAKILTHPLIGMVQTDSEIVLTTPQERFSAQTAQTLTDNKPAKVSYIPTDTFVDVLIDVLTANTGQKLYEEMSKAIDALPPSIEKSRFRELLRQIRLSGRGLNELRALIATLSDPEVKRSMLSALNLVDSALDKLEAENSDMIPLLLGIRQINDRYLKAALGAVLDTASSLQDAKLKMGQWFDNAMSRASQIYTSELQRFSLVVGFFLALILNVDTLHLARVLWEDPALRAVVATAAVTSTAELQEEIRSGVSPVTGDFDESVDAVSETLRQLLDLRLPIGWIYAQPGPDAPGGELGLRDDSRNLWYFWPGNNPDWLGLLVQKLIGLVVTMIAIAQGAPFWFDLLNRLAQGRRSNSDAG